MTRRIEIPEKSKNNYKNYTKMKGKQEKTVNQLLEILTEKYSSEEIGKSSFLKKLKDKLLEIKFHTINGGKVLITNSSEILSRIMARS